MATTPNGIVYPAETDSGDVAYWAGQQALSVDKQIDAGQLIATPGSSSTVQPITTTGNNYTVGGGGVSVVLTSTRKLRVWVQVDVTSATATGQFNVRVGANQTAFDLTSVTAFDHGLTRWTTVTGANGTESLTVEATNHFGTGTWIFYPVVRRLNGGTSSDSVTNALVTVYDAGPV